MQSQVGFRNIPSNKASRGDEIPVELFQILKDDAVKVLHSICQYASKFGKLSRGHRIGTGQFSFPSQRRAKPKNVQTILQLCSFHILVKLCSKSFKLGFQLYVNQKLPDVQPQFRKGRGARDQIANICWIIEKAREFQKNIYLCFIDYVKAFDCVDHNKLENSSRGGNTRTPYLPPE